MMYAILSGMIIGAIVSVIIILDGNRRLEKFRKELKLGKYSDYS